MHARVSVDSAPSGSLPLVLVHGIGVASRFMVPVAELLAPYHRVYAPDLPGSGKSEKPAYALSLVELTDDLAGWTRAIGLEGAAFLGNSFGCQIVAGLALRYPGLVERVVLQGPTMDPRGRTAWQQVARWLRNSRRTSTQRRRCCAPSVDTIHVERSQRGRTAEEAGPNSRRGFRTQPG
jgi:2-hydroxy-6-oxonona-2,4-dienedioate hydrolase